MLIILGSPHVGEPWILARHWAAKPVAVLTPADLSRPGWRVRPGRPELDRIVAQGEIVQRAQIEAVVSTIPSVSVQDLAHIVAGDREYVAAEMTAFLLAWLSDLACPVLDRPSATSLSGCGRRAWQWIAMARALGIDAPPPDLDGVEDAADVTVVAGRAIEPPSRAIGTTAERLAKGAGRELVTLRFSPAKTPRFLGARHVPAVDHPGVARALLDELGR